MMMRMRTTFHEQLDDLTDRLASMCHLAGEAIEAATDALVQADLPLAERVFDLTDKIEALRVPARSRRWRCWRCRPQSPGTCARSSPGCIWCRI